MNSTRLIICCSLLSVLMPLAALAGIPALINYQGYLTTAAGVPVTSPAQSMTFRIYSSNPPRSNPVWTESRSVAVTDGIYSVQLGEINPIAVPFNGQYLLGVAVGTDPEMTPYQKLSSVPTAFRAAVAETVPDGAITDAKIRGPISVTKIDLTGFNYVSRSGDTMTGSLILPADGLQVGANQLRLSGGNMGIGVVPTQKLDVAGTVKATSFSGDGSGLTGLNADNLATGTVPEGRLPATVQRKAGKVAVVAQSGGDYTSPVTAMNSLASWCGTPSATNPCLLKIMPGVYELGANPLIMQQYVDVEGSGEKTTLISAAIGGGSYPPPSGVVNGASNAEIRFLSLRNVGSGSYVAGMVNNGTAPHLTHLSIAAAGGAFTYGLVNTNSAAPVLNSVTLTAAGTTTGTGVLNDASAPTLNDVLVTAQGGTNASVGINNISASPVLKNVTVTASGGTSSNNGIYNGTSAPVLGNVRLTVTGGVNTTGIYNFTGSAPTLQDVVVNVSGGSASNFGIYNSASSPVISALNATVAGGTASYGVYNTGSSSPVIGGGSVAASGGANVYGIYNSSISDPLLENLSVVASGGTANYGIYSSSSFPVLTRVTVSASGGTGSNYGIYNASFSAPDLRDVVASASAGANSYGIYNDASTPSLSNVIARGADGTAANYGIYNTAAIATDYLITIDRSTCSGATGSIRNDPNFTLRIGATKLEGGAVNASGIYTCVGVYTGETYAPLSATCQ